MVLSRIKKLKQQIEIFEGTKMTIEQSQMATEMAQKIEGLRKRVSTVTGINTEELETNMDIIQEVKEHMQHIDNTVSDTMQSVWNMNDVQAEELFEQFMNGEDEYEIDAELNVKETVDDYVIEPNHKIDQAPPITEMTPKDKNIREPVLGIF
jgi:hypothetical protein